MKRILPRGTTLDQLQTAILQMVSNFDAKKSYVVTVEEWRRPRTNQQNAYLWGVVYPSILEGGGEALSGFTRDDLHEWLLGECFGWEVLEGLGRKRMRPVRRSSVLTKQEFTDYLMFIEIKCAEMGIIIPAPNEADHD